MSLFLDLDNLYLSEELREVRRTIRRFIDDEVKPHAAQWEDDGRVPREVYRRMGELGILGIPYPEAFGGSDLGLFGTLVLGEELGRSTYGGVAGAIALQTDMSAGHLARHGSPALQERFLRSIVAGRTVCAMAITEPDAGSDVASLKTSARADGGDFVLNGSKMFITSGVHADVYFVAARTDAQARGAHGVSLFVVEKGTPGFSVRGPLKKTGWLSSDTAQLFFDEVRVPAGHLIGQLNKGFQHVMEGFEHERFSIGGICVGHCEAAIELTLQWLANRNAFGAKLWDLHGIRLEMARLLTELSAAKALLYQSVDVAARGGDARTLAAMVKAHLPPLTNRILYQCVQYHGGMGFMRETAVERLSRDSRVLAIGGGATEVMLIEVAKHIQRQMR
ncbi:MAG: acyl-CoA dehydrogenase family protein [Rubrivivax sp.]